MSKIRILYSQPEPSGDNYLAEVLAARGETAPTRQLVHLALDAIRLLVVIVYGHNRQRERALSDAYAIVFRALNLGRFHLVLPRLPEMLDTPEWLTTFTPLEHLWVVLLPPGTPLTPKAFESLSALARTLSPYLKLNVPQSRDLMAKLVGGPSFTALLKRPVMPGPALEAHGNGRQPWVLFHLCVSLRELRWLLKMALEKDRLRTEIRRLVEARCLALASAHARKNEHQLDEFDCVNHRGDLLGQLWRVPPEDHAARWTAGSSEGHLDAYLFGYEADDGLIAWLSRAIEAVGRMGTAPVLSVTIYRSAWGEPVPTCVHPSADLRHYESRIADEPDE
jgi:hypothetical protein